MRYRLRHRHHPMFTKRVALTVSPTSPPKALGMFGSVKRERRRKNKAARAARKRNRQQ